jgi:hypothetical protein
MKVETITASRMMKTTASPWHKGSGDYCGSSPDGLGSQLAYALRRMSRTAGCTGSVSHVAKGTEIKMEAAFADFG